MKRTYKNIFRISIGVVIALAGAGSSSAQAYEWRLISSDRQGDRQTMVERAADGRTKTTIIHFFRHKPTVAQSENQSIKDPSGNKLSVKYWRWDSDGRKIAEGEEFYDGRGYTFKGKRWYYAEENGRILDPRIEEEFNMRTRQWERIVRPETVRIISTPSRRSDADMTAVVLRRNGFVVEMRAVAASEDHDSPHRGRLYYQADGTASTASRIASFAASVERVVTARGTTGAESNPPDYSLWIVGSGSRIDLNGEWMGTGYHCRGAEPPQRVRIQHVGNQVTIVKMTGDTCITSGEVTIRGIFNGNPFNAELHILEGDRKRFISTTVRVHDRNNISGGGVTFRRVGS